MRNRMTKRRAMTAKSILAEINALEKKIRAVEDAELAEDALEISEDDATEMSDNPGVLEDAAEILEQNEKSNDNWPVDIPAEAANDGITASERAKIASVLMKCASILLAEDGEIGTDDDDEDAEHEPDD